MEVLLRALACLCLLFSWVTAQSEQDVCYTASRNDFISLDRYDTSKLDFRNKLLPEMKKIMCTGGCQDKISCRLSVAFDSKHRITFLKEDHSGAVSCDESDWVRSCIGAITLCSNSVIQDVLINCLHLENPKSGGEYLNSKSNLAVSFEEIPPPSYERLAKDNTNTPGEPEDPDEPDLPPLQQLPDSTEPFTFYVIARRYSTQHDATRFTGLAMYGRDTDCPAIATRPTDYSVANDFYVMDDINDSFPTIEQLPKEIGRVAQLNLKGQQNPRTDPCGLDTTYMFLKYNDTRWGRYQVIPPDFHRRNR
jgi:hypothetical protein